MKETIFINLESYEWRQSLRAERGKRYNGRSLQMAARVHEGHRRRLATFTIPLSLSALVFGSLSGCMLPAYSAVHRRRSLRI
jgi:hypothetical protein